jgi:hypothetical protein
LKTNHLATLVARLDDFSPIGRLFLLQFFEKYLSSQNSRASFFHGKRYALTLMKNVFGNILGEFQTNSSGHPAEE